jgi:hypothetical protein
MKLSFSVGNMVYPDGSNQACIKFIVTTVRNIYSVTLRKGWSDSHADFPLIPTINGKIYHFGDTSKGDLIFHSLYDFCSVQSKDIKGFLETFDAVYRHQCWLRIKKAVQEESQ